MAVDYDATVINVNYRLAPEHKMPCGIDDCYAALKWVIAKSDYLGINKNKIVTMGESGGGYICAGVSMRLAEANEGKLIKFSAQIIPMVSNRLFITPDSELAEQEVMFKTVNKEVYMALVPNY